MEIKKKKALDRTVWKTSFSRTFGLVITVYAKKKKDRRQSGNYL
jgi:hypothetical protein